jgi:hypothetical protein
MSEKRHQGCETPRWRFDGVRSGSVRTRMLRIAAFFLVLCLPVLGGCAPIPLPGGQPPFAHRIAALKIGESTRDDVISAMAEPHFFSHKPEIYVYSGRYESFRIMWCGGVGVTGGCGEPQSIFATQTVIARFDTSGTLSAVDVVKDIKSNNCSSAEICFEDSGRTGRISFPAKNDGRQIVDLARAYGATSVPWKRTEEAARKHWIAALRAKGSYESLQTAANCGDYEATVEIGIKFESEKGVPNNYLEAYFWYGVAQKQATTSSDKLGADVYRKVVKVQLSPDQIVEAERRIEEWQPDDCRRYYYEAQP